MYRFYLILALATLPPATASAAAPELCFSDPDSCAAYFAQLSTSTDAQERFIANRELGVLAYENGELKKALKHFEAALALRPEDPFCTLEKAWTLLSSGEPRKAEGEFKRATGLSPDAGSVLEAKLGLALAAMYEGNRDSAATQLRLLYTKEPLLISFAAERLGLIMERSGRPQYAGIYYQQALQHDPYNQLAAAAMARLSEKDGAWVQAWQYYATLSGQDPRDQLLASKMDKLAPKLKGDPVNYLFYSKLSAPFQVTPRFTYSPPLRVGLFCGQDGGQAGIYSFTLQSGSSFTVVSQTGTPLAFGKPRAMWTFQVNREDGSIEIRNQWGTVELATTGRLDIVPSDRGASNVVKSARAGSLFAADLSDRELRGILTVYPSTAGMTLVDSTPLEDFLPGAVGSSKIPGQERLVPLPEELKALAVVLRTRALQAIKQAAPNARYDLADSQDGIKYFGVNYESLPALAAVDETNGVVLKDSDPQLHFSCGGATDRAVDDNAYRPAEPEPSSQRSLLSATPGELLCAPQDPTRWATNSWLIAVSGDDLQRRAKRDYPQLGRVKALRPARRAPDGRVLALEVKGSRSALVLEGADKIASLLGPGAIRSPKFKLTVLYKGSEISEIYVRGKGTGHLRGLCLLGSHGLADDGKPYTDILAHYFPGSTLAKINYSSGQETALEAHKSSAPAAAPQRQPAPPAGK